MRSLFAVLLLIFSIGAGLAETSPISYENNPKFDEIYRIKIWNLPGGTIEVSRDEGKNWETVGKVLYPTVKTNSESYAAARWVDDGKVAATAVNAIHIKTGTSIISQEEKGVVFSVLPKEFLKKPKNYKSYLSSDSSIYTDIPAGENIFGGGYAPFVGNVVLVSRTAKEVIPLPQNYVPQVGEKIYILVDRPVDYPREIIFENSAGGKVTIAYFNGVEKVIGQIVQPVSGVGRFEGTKYASVGRIRANHAGVIDVATSPIGGIGGFQIVPSKHSSSLKFTQNPQWMVVAPVGGGTNEALEGKAPFFKYFIKPVYGTNDLEDETWENKLLERFLVEVKVKGSDKWQAMPAYEFDEYGLTGSLPAWSNKALSEITYIRILFPAKGTI